MINKRVLLGAALITALTGVAIAQSKQFFRIGTGGTGGTYYPVGGLFANGISSDKIDASAVATNGSVANVNGIVGGSMESGFSQADVAAWAFTGTGLWTGRPKVDTLRSIANLYPESVHVVVKKGSGIKSVADLKGKRISIDEPGSGTIINAKAILAAYGIGDADYKAENLKTAPSADKLKDGGLDAFFVTAGFPTAAVTELVSTAGAEIIPIDGAQAEALRKNFAFFAADEIPANTYKDIGAVKTLSVGAQWITSSSVSADLVYEVTKAAWSDKTRALLDNGHAKGKAIVRPNAITGLGAPLHDGAAKFYKEVGVLK